MDAVEISDPESEAPKCFTDSADPVQTEFRAHLQRFAYTSTSHPSPPLGTSSMPSTRATAVSRKPVAGDDSSNSLATAASGQRAGRKRGSDREVSSREGTPKKRRSSAKERSATDPYNPENNLVDSLRPGLILVICGLNPGLQTAATGHAYAHPSNRFWHLLHESGITPKKHLPRETHDLPDLYAIGNTNICARPTRDGSTLSKEELREGAEILEAKMAEFKPEAVAIVGKQIWESLWLARTGTKLKASEFKWGWQDEEAWLGRTINDEGNVIWPGARTFVTTSTSGLSATLRPHEKLEIWKPLGEWFTARRKERNEYNTA